MGMNNKIMLIKRSCIDTIFFYHALRICLESVASISWNTENLIHESMYSTDITDKEWVILASFCYSG